MKSPKRVLLIVLIVFGVVLVAGISAAILQRPPDFSKLSDQQVVAYLASKNVAKLRPAQMDVLVQRVSKMAPQERFGAARNLPEKERQTFRNNNREVFQARMDSSIKEFFALPKEQQDAYLDSQIDRMEARRAEFMARGGFGGRGPGGPGLQGGTRSDSGPAGQQVQGGRMGGRNRSPDARLQRRRNMLSDSTPEQRAMRTEYFRRLRERMAARGITFGGRRGG